MKRRVVLGLLLIAFVGASSAVADQPTTRPSSPALVDIDGVVRRPLDLGENRAAVVIFVRTDCPISNQHAPEIRRLADEFGPKRIAFYLAYAARSLPVAEAREHAKQYGLSLPAMIDRRHDLVKALGATVTPEAVVVVPDGAIAYRGRIDDLFVALGRQRNAATTRELRDALEAVVAGKPPKVARAVAVGCAITED